MVLGISSAISPVALIRGKHNRYSASYGIFGYGLDLCRNQEKIERKEGIIMVVVYLVYCAYIIAR